MLVALPNLSTIVAMARVAGTGDFSERSALLRAVRARVPFGESRTQVAGVLAENPVLGAGREHRPLNVTGQQCELRFGGRCSVRLTLSGTRCVSRIDQIVLHDVHQPTWPCMPLRHSVGGHAGDNRAKHEAGNEADEVAHRAGPWE